VKKAWLLSSSHLPAETGEQNNQDKQRWPADTHAPILMAPR